MQRLLPDCREGEELEPLAFEASATAIVASALATRDYSPLHHDERYAREAAGHPGIFLNSPAQQALIGRFISARLGPRARPGRLRLAMRASVYAGEVLEIGGQLVRPERDQQGCGWVELALRLAVAGEERGTATARVALPVDDNDNPWRRHGREWQP